MMKVDVEKMKEAELLLSLEKTARKKLEFFIANRWLAELVRRTNLQYKWFMRWKKQDLPDIGIKRLAYVRHHMEEMLQEDKRGQRVRRWKTGNHPGW